MEPEKFFELVGGKTKGMVVKNIDLNFISQVSYPDSVSSNSIYPYKIY